MYIKFVRGGGISFLNPEAKFFISLPVKDSSDSSLRFNDAPIPIPSIQRPRSLEQAVRDHYVQIIVQIVYRKITARSSIMRYVYRTMFHRSSFDADRNAGDAKTERTANVANQLLILENYCEMHHTSLIFQHVGSPLPSDRAGLPTYVRSFTRAPGGLCWKAAPTVHISGNSEPDRDNEENVRVTFKKIKPSSKYVEWGTFSWLYPDEEAHVPFDIGIYVSANGSRVARSDSSAVMEGLRRYSNITSADV